MEKINEKNTSAMKAAAEDHHFEIFDFCIQITYCKRRNSSVALFPPTPFSASLGRGHDCQKQSLNMSIHTESLSSYRMFLHVASITDFTYGQGKYGCSTRMIQLTLRSSFVSGRLSFSSVMTCVAPSAVSRSERHCTSGLER